MTRAFTYLLVMLAVLATHAQAQTTPTGHSIPYLTLRDRISDSEGFYGDERSTLKGGRCIVDGLRLDFLSGAAQLAPFRIPEEILTVEAVQEMPVDAVMDTLKSKPPLLYIHGYYIGFDKGCRRATALKENAGLDGRFLWFTWPSQGALVSYARDETNLYWSVPELADVITKLHDRYGPGVVDLAGHSLGARGMALALYEVAGTRPDLRFGDVALMASDMGFDIFAQMLPRIRPIVRSITIYTSDRDAALDVSEQLHGYPRLGQSGNDVSRLKGAEIIDTSDLALMSASGHLYHIHNREMGRDLNALLNRNLPAAKRKGLEQQAPNLWRLLPDD